MVLHLFVSITSCLGGEMAPRQERKMGGRAFWRSSYCQVWDNGCHWVKPERCTHKLFPAWLMGWTGGSFSPVSKGISSLQSLKYIMSYVRVWRNAKKDGGRSEASIFLHPKSCFATRWSFIFPHGLQRFQTSVKGNPGKYQERGRSQLFLCHKPGSRALWCSLSPQNLGSGGGRVVNSKPDWS